MTIKRNKMVFPLDADEFVQNIKESKSGDILSTSFEVRNTSNTKIKLELLNKESNLKIRKQVQN